MEAEPVTLTKIKQEEKPMRRNIILTLFVLVALMVFTGIAAGQAADDNAIQSEIANKIQANPALSIGNVYVESKNGHVTLSGEAANEMTMKQIIAIAKSTPGVKSVKSNLKIYQQK
jgi:osmotically-inducible protein OsmY